MKQSKNQTIIPRVRDSLEKLPDIKGKLRQLKKKTKCEPKNLKTDQSVYTYLNDKNTVG